MPQHTMTLKTQVAAPLLVETKRSSPAFFLRIQLVAAGPEGSKRLTLSTRHFAGLDGVQTSIFAPVPQSLKAKKLSGCRISGDKTRRPGQPWSRARDFEGPHAVRRMAPPAASAIDRAPNRMKMTPTTRVTATPVGERTS